MSQEEDPDIAIIKARKMKELQKQAAAFERSKMKRDENEQQEKQKQKIKPKTDREILASYLYDRGEEVLTLAESQFPIQTRVIVSRVVELIKAGMINERISGGELLTLFRSIGLFVRVNTNIKIEDHGKLISFSDKLRQENEDMANK